MFQRAPSPAHLTLVFDQKQTCSWSCTERFLKKKKKANIDKCLHLAGWITPADGRWDAHFGGRCALSLVAKRYRRGSLHLKWRPFTPDYYNLFHLAKWNAPQRGLWSGLKTAVWGHRGRWETDPVLCEETWAESCTAPFRRFSSWQEEDGRKHEKRPESLTDLNEYLTYSWTGSELTFHNLIDKCNLFWDGVEKQTGTGIRHPPWWWSTKAGRQICWLSSSVGPPGSKQMAQLWLNTDHTPTRIRPSPPTHTLAWHHASVCLCVCVGFRSFNTWRERNMLAKMTWTCVSSNDIRQPFAGLTTGTWNLHHSGFSICCCTFWNESCIFCLHLDLFLVTRITLKEAAQWGRVLRGHWGRRLNV